MIIIPAIDIKNGKCVRLTKGDFAREKIYSDDPIAVAKLWEKQGATMIHVVDLDGAKNGKMKNFAIIKKLVKTITIPVQVGGGIRDKKTVEKLLSIGVAKIVLGTVAIENKYELQNILDNFGKKIVIALDTKNGKLFKNGWLKNSEMDVIDTALELEDLGIQRFIYTDIKKDGTMTTPNFKEIKKLIENISMPVIVSGGISDIDQIKKLKELNVDGVILGKALYERRLNLKELVNL